MNKIKDITKALCSPGMHSTSNSDKGKERTTYLHKYRLTKGNGLATFLYHVYKLQILRKRHVTLVLPW